MTMNHINLPVKDVPANRAFFEKHFGFRCIMEKGADKFVGFIDDGGMVLAFSNFKGVDHVEYPEWFHSGFMQRDDAGVDEVFRAPEGRRRRDWRAEGHARRVNLIFQGPGGAPWRRPHQRDQDVFAGLSR